MRIRAILGWGGAALQSVGLTLLPTGAWACAVCVGWPRGSGADQGYVWSYLLLTALPFALVGAIGAWIRRALRRSAEREAPAGDER